MKTLSLLFIFTINLCWGQSIVTGRLLDDFSGQPIQNANVSTSTSGNAAFSNARGYFQLGVSKQDTLTISHVAYGETHILVPEQGQFKMFLERNYKYLFIVKLRDYPYGEEFKPAKRKPAGTSEKMVQSTSISTKAIEEEPARYPGGFERLKQHLGNNLAYQKSILKDRRELVIQFEVDGDGAVQNVIHDLIGDQKRDAKLFEAFKKLDSWVPAKQRQKPVSDYFSIILTQ